MEGHGGFLNLAIKVKPPQNLNDSSENIMVEDKQEVSVLFFMDTKQGYLSDRVFLKDSVEEEIYQHMVQPLVKHVFYGYNSTVFAYGQTGSGKTYTIGTDPNRHGDGGFILRTLEEFFNNQEEQKEICIKISFCEIYNETVYDLLIKKDAGPLKIVDFKVQGLTEICIKSTYEACSLLKTSTKNRHGADRNQNNDGSCSHTIFTIHCKVKHENHETSAKLYLVDLAGSENVKQTTNNTTQTKDSIYVNLCLLVLGRVMHALSTNSAYIPYCNSVLTSLLKDSLGHKNLVVVVVCISSDSQDRDKTVETLDFAQKLYKLKNSCKPNLLNGIDTCENPLPSKKLKSSWRSNITSLKHSRCTSTFNIAKKARILNTLTNMVQEQPQMNSREDCWDFTCTASLLTADLVDIPLVEKSKPFTRVSVNDNVRILMKNLKRLHHQAFLTQPQLKQTDMGEIIERSVLNKQCNHINSTRSNTTDSGKSNLGMINMLPIVNSQLTLNDGELLTKAENRITVPPPKEYTNNKKQKVSELSSSSHNEMEPSTSMAVPRRSLRIATKNNTILTYNIQTSSKTVQTSRVRNRKKTSNNGGGRSIISNHHTYVLQLLNEGTVKDLQKLSSVGVKTATQIYTFRQLKGKFRKLEDLAKLPSWRGNAYQRFLKQNFLK